MTSLEFRGYGLTFFFLHFPYYVSHLPLLKLVFTILFVDLVLFKLINIKILVFQVIDLPFYIESVYSRYYIKVHLLTSTNVSAK